MSFLMAEMYDLGLARQEASGIFDDSPLLETEEAMIGFQEKQEKAKKAKQLKEIRSHLDNVLERVGYLLTEIGISPELPPPHLVQDNKWGSTALAFRPPPESSDDGRNADAKARMRSLLSAFAATADYRDQLMMELIEWFASCQINVSDQSQEAPDNKLLNSERESSDSMEVIMAALENANEALKKLQKIGTAMFEDKDEDEDPFNDAVASGISGNTAARLNARVRKASLRLDTLPTALQAPAMKSAFVPHNLPDDIESMQASFDEDDEEEQLLLEELANNWQDVCDEIRDIIITVHELKIMKRSTKLAVRRVLYLFKLVVALLAQRSEMAKSKESAMIKLKAEANACYTKIDHLHKEAKNWREKLTTSQARNLKLTKETEALENEVNALNSDLSEKEGVIADLSQQLAEMEDSHQITPSPVEEQGSMSDKVREKISALNLKTRMQKQRIEELEEEIGETGRSLEREKIAHFRAQETRAKLEDDLEETKIKLRTTEVRTDKLEETLERREDTITSYEKELDATRNELKAKEELVAKLTDVGLDDDDPRDVLKRRVSVKRRHSTRRQSVRRSSVRRRRSGAGSSTGVADESAEDVSVGIESRTTLGGLIRVSSTRVLEKRSRSSVALPLLPDVTDDDEIQRAPPITITAEIPTIEPMSSTNISSDASPEPPSVPPPSRLLHPQQQQPPHHRRFSVSSALLERRRSVNVVSTTEYKRVLSELRETQKNKNELQAEIDELNKELEDQEDRFEQMQNEAERHHKVKMLLEEEKLKSGTGKVYAEYLKVEAMVVRFKGELSSTLEKALMVAAAKQAKSAYKYNAPSNPIDYVDSAMKISEQFQCAFEAMIEAIRLAIQTMKLAQNKLKRSVDDQIGQETVQHMKVLAAKSQIIEDLQNRVETYKAELDELRDQQQKAAKENFEILCQLSEALKIKNKASAKLKEYEKGVAKKSQRGGLLGNSTDGRPLTKESLEVMLQYARDQHSKIKRRLAETEGQLEKEKVNRYRLENALIANKSRVQPKYGEGTLAVHHRNLKVAPLPTDQPCSDQVPRSTTGTERYVKTLRQIEESASQSKRKFIDRGLLSRINHVTRHWNAYVIMRWVALVRRYVQYTSYQIVLDKVGKDVIECQNTPKSAGLQACFWHIQRKKQFITENKESKNEFDSAVQQCRNQVVAIFRQVGFAVIALKKKGALELDAKRPPSSKEEDPVPPSNSALSQSSSIRTIPAEQLSKETPAADEEDGEQDTVQELSKAMSVNTRSIMLVTKPPPVSRVSTAWTERSNTTSSDSQAEPTSTQSQELPSADSDDIDEQNTDHPVPLCNVQILPKVPENADFSPKFFARRFSTNSSDPVKTKCSTAPESECKQWLRDDSMVRSSRRRRTLSSMQRRSSSQMMKKVYCDVPRALEMDIRQDLNTARKNLQNAMRRSSITPDCTTPVNLGKRELRQRRKTLAFLGLDQNQDEIPSYSSRELVNMCKNHVSPCDTSPSSSDVSLSMTRPQSVSQNKGSTEHFRTERPKTGPNRRHRSSIKDVSRSSTRLKQEMMTAKSLYGIGKTLSSGKQVSLQDLNQQVEEPLRQRRSRANESELRHQV